MDMTIDNARAWFLKGKEFLKKNDLDNACRSFSRAYAEDKESADYLSYYGMCSALRRGEVGLGLELCTRAIKKEFFKDEYYVNLARVYICADNKKGAIAALSKGLKIKPDSQAIHDVFLELGIRKRSPIPFLKRTSLVNKYLGILFRRIR
ncbi:MAG: hypothetical protein HY880_06010 [Deltaproteobacteria bacterium]|nr:hypothetical protein [Deltaproteobacteria bacterium]